MVDKKQSNLVTREGKPASKGVDEELATPEYWRRVAAEDKVRAEREPASLKDRAITAIGRAVASNASPTADPFGDTERHERMMRRYEGPYTPDIELQKTWLPSEASQQPSPTGPQVPTYDQPEEGEDPQFLLQQLDTHISQLPPKMLQMFEDGFKEYPKLPELLSTLMPEAYEYFKMVQQALTQQPPQDSPMAGGSPAPQPAGEPAQGPLMGGAQPAKATSALGL